MYNRAQHLPIQYNTLLFARSLASCHSYHAATIRIESMSLWSLVVVSRRVSEREMSALLHSHNCVSLTNGWVVCYFLTVYPAFDRLSNFFMCFKTFRTWMKMKWKWLIHKWHFWHAECLIHTQKIIARIIMFCTFFSLRKNSISWIELEHFGSTKPLKSPLWVIRSIFHSNFPYFRTSNLHG